MAPNSGIVAVNNSQGASAAALELGRILDSAFREGQIFGDVDEEEDSGGSESKMALDRSASFLIQRAGCMERSDQVIF